jgi:hypothetical protein
MKYLYILFLIVFFPILTFGQNEYFSTDITTSTGIKLIDGGDLINSKLCQVKKGNGIIEYTPYEVKEFGFKDGRVYVSKEIQLSDSTKKVFLERLYEGKTTLYYYKEKGRKSFFIEKDGSLFVELQKRNRDNKSYNEQLSDITNDCSNVAGAVNLVNYNKKSITKLVSRYNNCELKPFPHFRYGVTLGYEFMKLVTPSGNQNEDIKYFDFKYDGSYAIGLFIDNPISVSDFSLHSELYFSKHGFSYNKRIANEDIDFVANLSTLKVPLLIRYAIPSNKIRPFINIGMVGSLNIRNKTQLYTTTISENKIEIGDIKLSSPIDNIQFGYCMGGGMEYKLKSRNSLFFEIRYTSQYGISNPGTLKTSGFNFVTGINF